MCPSCKIFLRFVCAWLREDQGFIERQIATPASHLANVEFGTPVDFVPVGKVPGSSAVGAGLAARYMATESVAIDASIFYDEQHYRGYKDVTTGPRIRPTP